MKASLVCLFAATLLATPGHAAPVQLASRVMIEQRALAADGTVRITLVPAMRAVPGDRLIYTLDYRNTGDRPIENIVLDNPLPGGIAYRAPADGSPAPELSVDGRTFGPLAALRVEAASGPRAATAADVTHVRWRIPGALAAGAAGAVAFQAALK